MMKRTITLLIMVGALWGSPQPVQAQADATLFQRVNALRTSLGLSPYTRNPALDAAAANHARWMANNGAVSHTQEDGSTPRVRAQRAGYNSQWVSENIYGGTNATASTAWTWWLNSPVHYRGITSPNYNNIGIGYASSGWGSAFVLVFGNSTGSWTIGGGNSVSVSSGGGGNSSAAAAPAVAAPPSFVVGVDAYGNIMHEVQPGDTLGEIALTYGYSWDDLPAMRDLNAFDEQAGDLLEIGSVFLVPPQDGTYTPTPGDPPTATRTPQVVADADAEDNDGDDPDEGAVGDPVTVEAPTATPTITPPPTATATPTQRVATSAAPVDVALLISPVPLTATPVLVEAPAERTTVQTSEPRRPMWLYVAIGAQIALVVAAGAEMFRRGRR